MDDTTETAQGHVKLHDFEDTNGEDYEIHVTSTSSSDLAQKSVDAIKHWEGEFRKILLAWKQEVLQQ